MSESNFSTATTTVPGGRTSPKWLNHSNRSLISILNGYFEDKEPPRPSSFYRFYWFCCHHPKGELAPAPSKLQCLLRNPLMESRCKRCGHVICTACQRIAQQETVDTEHVEEGLASVPEDPEIPPVK